MTLQTYVAIAELIAAIAVVISLIYLAVQVRQGNRVNSAAARHALSQFALDFSMFKAGHSDRLAKVLEETDLNKGDLQFRWWNHMMVFLHAETYYHHYELKLIPKKHWSGYVKYVQGYLESPGVREFWDDVGDAFSVDFSQWISSQLDDIDS
jgi:hypothetical protein